MNPTRIGGYFAALLILVAVHVVAAPRITETFAVAAPADFELREPEDLRRLASFPASRLTSLDDHAPLVSLTVAKMSQLDNSADPSMA